MILGQLFARRTLTATLLLGAVLLFAGGCSGRSNEAHVSGQVLFEGKPVPAGEIYFDPDVGKKHDGLQGYARIKDGKFDTREFDKPLTPGPHVVRILGYDGRTIPEAPFGRVLFTEYQTSADVSAAGEVKLDFNVPANAKSR